MKHIANLDNEVYFKNVFTDVEIFKGFVKDILGIEMNVSKVETESVWPTTNNPSKYILNLSAKNIDNNVVVEVHKIDYAYSRFSDDYFVNLTDLQKSCKIYSSEKNIYIIVIITSAYKISEKKGRHFKEYLVLKHTDSNNLKGEIQYIENQKVVILDATNIHINMPKRIKDWLDFIIESQKNEQDLKQINRNNKAIAKAFYRLYLHDLRV